MLVITPTLGSSPWLADVVSDVASLSRTIRAAHVLVAPAGAVDALRARWPGVRVVQEPAEGGMYAAINAGVASVDNWRWLIYLNDDDRLLPACADGIREAAGCDVVYGDVTYIDAEGRALARMPVCRRSTDILALLARGTAAFTQQGTLVGRALWERLGGFDASLKLAADHDFWLRAAAGGASFRRVDACVASYRIHPGQLSGNVAAAGAELRVVCGRTTATVSAWRTWCALARFRMSNAGRILTRLWRTGRVRSRRLYCDGAKA